MRFPLSWLKAWVDVPADISALQVLLMRAGVGLEALEDPGAALRGVVVARVERVQPHPNADRLRVCQVSDGTREYQIVCGAPNVVEGMLAPLALEGAQLPGGLGIKKSRIRGIESQGMLCSAGELGLPAGVDGLLALDRACVPGTPCAEALGLDDPILTLETTANRPDHLSLRGLAREVAALGGLALREPPLRDLARVRAADAPAAGPGPQAWTVWADPEACSYYSARRLTGVKVGPSPEGLRRFLEKSGLRSVNNVVDATNAALLETGQPLHAFDAARLAGTHLEARLARPGERLRTLDGQDRALDAQDAVVADAAGPQALAGIMGGALSEIGPETRDVVLEAAVFPSRRLRRTSRRLGLRSDSSLRFERGVDPFGVDEALDRCAALILELAGGAPLGPRLCAGSKGQAPAAVALDPARVNGLLGTSLDGGAMASLLRRRGFQVEPLPGSAGFRAVPPTWRPDVRAGVDLAEEVLQMAGMDAVASTRPASSPEPQPDDVQWRNAVVLRRRMAGLGLREATTLSAQDPARLRLWGLDPAAPILDNPLSAESAALRPSLLPGLVDCALGALRRRQEGVALFEWGRVFQRAHDGTRERPRLAAVLAGQAEPGQWNAAARAWGFYDLKGVAEALARGLELSFRAQADAAPPAWAHPGRCAALSLGGLAGTLAELHPSLLAALDAPKALESVVVLELEPQSPDKDLAKEPRHAPFARVPSVERDLSCLMDRALEAGRLLDFIRKEGGLGVARVLDRFEGPPLPPGRKSLTFRLTYAAQDRSLTDAEVNERHEELARRLETALPVEVRR